MDLIDDSYLIDFNTLI